MRSGGEPTIQSLHGVFDLSQWVLIYMYSSFPTFRRTICLVHIVGQHYVSCIALGVAFIALSLKSSHQVFLTGVPNSRKTRGHSSLISHLSTHLFVQNLSSAGPSSQLTTSAISIFG